MFDLRDLVVVYLHYSGLASSATSAGGILSKVIVRVVNGCLTIDVK